MTRNDTVLNRLSELQKALNIAETKYNILPSEKNHNDLIIIRDELEIYLKMHNEDN